MPLGFRNPASQSCRVRYGTSKSRAASARLSCRLVRQAVTSCAKFIPDLWLVARIVSISVSSGV